LFLIRSPEPFFFCRFLRPDGAILAKDRAQGLASDCVEAMSEPLNKGGLVVYRT
jgi:hypothetical protein